MSIAAFAVAQAPVAVTTLEKAPARSPGKRLIVAIADTRLVPEAR